MTIETGKQNIAMYESLKVANEAGKIQAQVQEDSMLVDNFEQLMNDIKE